MTLSEPRRSHDPSQLALEERFAAARALSEALVEPLSEADACIQSMEDASPAKWHLAHTTWFWETFLLRDHSHSYALFDDRYPYLFNSYYEAEGARYI
ncbi:MAG: DinB family protein, partial [Pseudomonadota bacterium]